MKDIFGGAHEFWLSGEGTSARPVIEIGMVAIVNFLVASSELCFLFSRDNAWLHPFRTPFELSAKIFHVIFLIHGLIFMTLRFFFELIPLVTSLDPKFYDLVNFRLTRGIKPNY